MSSASANIPPVEPWLAHLRRETERFADVGTQSPLLAHVPAYPDFEVPPDKPVSPPASGGGRPAGLIAPQVTVTAGW
jgi:hypothetical protein